MAFMEMVAEMKPSVEPNSGFISGINPAQLVVSAGNFPALPDDRTSPFANHNWFAEPNLFNIEECGHCKAFGNLISSEYGTRRDPRRRGIRFHDGIDIRMPQGSAVLAFHGGVVIRANRFSTYGLTVEIQQYDGMIARYAHLSTIMTEKGNTVDAGAQIGEVGRTGRATGAHLHFELIKDGDSINPLLFLTRVEQVVRCKNLELSRP